MQNEVVQYIDYYKVHDIKFCIKSHSEIDRDWLRYILKDYKADEKIDSMVSVIVPNYDENGYMRNHLNNLDVKDLEVETLKGKMLWKHDHTPIPPFLVEPYYGKYVLLHGCGVSSKDGIKTLIVGSSMSGKTYLTLSLLEEGYKLITDDLIVFDYEDNKLLPYSKPIGLRENTLRLDRRFKEYVENKDIFKLEFTANDGKKTWLIHIDDIIPDSLYKDKIDSIDRIMFLDGSVDDISEISFNEALSRISRSVIESGASKARVIMYLANMLGKVNEFLVAPARQSEKVASYVLGKDSITIG